MLLAKSAVAETNMIIIVRCTEASPVDMEQQVHSLVQACDQALKEPPPITESFAKSFLDDHPLSAVFGTLSTHEVTTQQLNTICGALDRVLSTVYGTSLLPSARSYAEAALHSHQHRLRRLGCEQLGRLLLSTQDEEQQQELELKLVTALQDVETGVAGEAEKALVAHVAARPTSFTALLSGSNPAGQLLQAMADGQSALQRMRVFALLTAAAASNRSNAEQLKQSDVVTQLLQQLSPLDPLACLVALQLLQELVVHIGGSAARFMQQLLLPSLLQLLDDPNTAPGAFPIAARLVAAAAEEAAAAVSSSASSSDGATAMHVDGAALSNGNAETEQGTAAQALVEKMQDVLDERGSASAEMEVVVLDAACQLALPSCASAALLATASRPLLQGICSRALGRTATPPVRLAALHALASIAGGERAGEAQDRSAALLPSAAAEDALRLAVYEAVAGTGGGVGAARSPAEAMHTLLQQPFDDTRTGVYRCCSALALRPWFAADICNNSGLLSRLCATDSEQGQQACEWRHSTVMALWATVQYVLGLPDDAREARFKQQLPPAVQNTLGAAVRGGPYGAGGGRTTQQAHFVATVPH